MGLPRTAPVAERVIPLLDHRARVLQPPAAAFAPATRLGANGQLTDTMGRPLRDLRISVTDRCNIRCFYCMPAENVTFRPQHELLTFEEISQVVQAAAELGVTKLRLTGGEPLVRRDLPQLIERLVCLFDQAMRLELSRINQYDRDCY